VKETKRKVLEKISYVFEKNHSKNKKSQQ